MSQNKNKRPAFLGIILICTAMSYGNISAQAAGSPTQFATKIDLSTAIATEDAALRLALSNQDTALRAAISSAIATEDTAIKALINALQVTVTSQQTTLNQAIAEIGALKNSTPTPKKVGDFHQGGVVFFVDPSGLHGLIASFQDMHLPDGTVQFTWGNGVDKVTGATGDGYAAGASNTAIIVAAQAADNPAGNFAAKVANDYSAQDDGTPCTGAANEVCYGDWYLPSKHELNLLYSQRNVVGGFAGEDYWSSTEFDANFAWSQAFPIPDQYDDRKGRTLRVRAVRAF